jgi:twitching motility protein PilT
MNSPNLWQAAMSAGASDIHVVTGSEILLRIDGVLQKQGTVQTAKFVEDLMKDFLSETQYKRFLAEQDLDASHELNDGTRFRINCHIVGGHPAFAARIIPKEIPTPDELLLPETVMNLARSKDGLILFTGPTGSGKSTSLASIIASLLLEKPLNVIALEDPIEFQIPPGLGVVQQRELGTDFPSFPEGLKHVLRQDPDIVMVGEMRDLETIALALTLAETGHLVLATLHTSDTSQTIDRIVDVFPPYQQSQVRAQLSLSLRAVVAQRLLPKIGGGRIANREILIRTPAVANIIRENRVQEMSSILQTSGADGMVTFDKDFKRLVKEGLTEQGGD